MDKSARPYVLNGNVHVLRSDLEKDSSPVHPKDRQEANAHKENGVEHGDERWRTEPMWQQVKKKLLQVAARRGNFSQNNGEHFGEDVGGERIGPEDQPGREPAAGA